MAIKKVKLNPEMIYKTIQGEQISFEIRDGLIYDSSQEEPYKYLTSANIPIIQMIISGAIRKRGNHIEYPGFVSAMDREYIEGNFDDYILEADRLSKASILNKTEEPFFVETDTINTKLEWNKLFM